MPQTFVPFPPVALAYILGPLGVKLIAMAIESLLKRALKDKLLLARLTKARNHLIKAVLYFGSAIVIWPITYCIMREGNVRAVFETFSATYVQLAMSVPFSNYVADLIMADEPEPMMWLHHGAAALGAILVNGISWCGVADRLLFAGAGIFMWSILSLNFVLYTALASYQLASVLRIKIKLVRFNVVFALVTDTTCHVVLITFLWNNWSQFEASHVPLVLVGIDLALLCEHVYATHTRHSILCYLKQRTDGPSKDPVDMETRC